MKKHFIEDFKNLVGLTDTTDLAVLKVDRKVTRDGKPYLDFTLRDRTGEIGAKVWSDNINDTEECRVGDVVTVEFEVREYRGSLELTLRSVKKLSEFDPDDFIPVPHGIQIDELKLELARRIDSIRDFDLRKLIDAFFDDDAFYTAYTNAPAGMYIHHDYRHGLLQHTLEILRILDSITEIYPDINRDLITTGALLHDVGKIRELKFSMSGTTEYTREGQLMGHIALGVLMIESKLPDDFPVATREKLLHIVLAHQGKREMGSPVLPATREALAVYYADMASTFMNIAEHERLRGLRSKDESAEFSDYNRHLGNAMLLDD